MKLEGKVAAITGGTRGIGRAIAEGILAEGGKVALNGRSEEKGAQALEVLEQEVRALVGREAAREADRERFGVHRVGNFTGLLGTCPACFELLAKAMPRPNDQPLSAPHMDAP